jgi:hypothetical protein
MIAAFIASYLAEAEYNAYIDEGWQVGMALATRVGMGRALQLYGMLGELPPGQVFTFENNGTTYHVEMVQDKSGQWYFTVWHEESSWSWASWDTVKYMEWDIKILHSANGRKPFR